MRTLFRYTVGTFVLAVFVLVVAIGCERKPAAPQASAGSAKTAEDLKAAEGVKTPAPEPTAATTKAPTTKKTTSRATATTKTVASKPATSASGTTRTNHVVITQQGCVSLEPQWPEITQGQPLELRSAMKTAVTIHVSYGAFDKTVYVVKPGATVKTGPALRTGSFSMWTDPPSCRDVPRGVRGPGPGVLVSAR